MISAALTQRLDVISGQVAISEFKATIEAQVIVTPKEGHIRQRGNIAVIEAGQSPLMACGDDGVHFNRALLTRPGAHPTP